MIFSGGSMTSRTASYGSCCLHANNLQAALARPLYCPYHVKSMCIISITKIDYLFHSNLLYRSIYAKIREH